MLPSHPVFVKPFANQSRGGDPLGLETPCSSLYQSVFAGLNNNVQYIRVYSALCWMVQQVIDYLGPDATEDAKNSAFASGLPKMLLLLVWANGDKGMAGLPGIKRDWNAESGKLHFSFESMPTARAQKALDDAPDEVGPDGIHFMTPTQYWPSFRAGLALLKDTSEDSWIMSLTRAGENLADAFGKTLHSLDRALLRWLRDPFDLTSTTKKLAPLHKTFALDARPSREERENFLNQFFPLSEAALSASETFEQRSKGLTLVLRVLSAGVEADNDGYMTVELIRQSMGVGLLPNLTPIDVENIEGIHETWRALQLAQYLRMALETLFRVAEVVTHQLATENSFHEAGHDRSATGISLQIARQALAEMPYERDVTVSVLMKDLQPVQENTDTLYEAGLHSDLWNPHIHMKKLMAKSAFKLSKGYTAPAASYALTGVLWCIAESLLVSRSVREKVTTSPSLSRLEALAVEHADRLAETFFAHVVREYVLKLHASVARERTTADIVGNNPVRNRFRIYEGDTGLERSLGQGEKLTTVKLMPDILRNALLLLTQAGLTEKAPSGESFRLTSQGRKWVTRAWR